MFEFPFILTASPLVQSLEHIAGFFFVLITLGILWSFTEVIGIYFKNLKPAIPAVVPKDVPIIPEDGMVEHSEDAISEEEVVALTAAVAFILGAKGRIVSIRSGNSDWSREGRRQHFASHKIR